MGRGWTSLDGVGRVVMGLDGRKGLDRVGQNGTGLDGFGRGWTGWDGVEQGMTGHHFTPRA